MAPFDTEKLNHPERQSEALEACAIHLERIADALEEQNQRWESSTTSQER